MKVSAKRKDLVEILSVVQSIAERRTVHSIYRHSLLRAEDSTLTFFSTDGEVFLKISGKGNVVEPGDVLFPAREVYELVREIEKDEIEIQSAESVVLLKTQNAEYKIQTLSSGEFPPPPQDEDYSKATKLKADDLDELIEKTIFATSTDESRYVLTGVLVEFEKGVCRFVASDGHRLSYYEKECEVENEGKVILPRAGINDIRRIVSSMPTDFEIFISEKITKFEGKGITLWVTNISEEYPDWRAVVPDPTGYVAKITASTTELKRAFKRASLFATSKLPYVKLTTEKGKLKIEAEAVELGKSTEWVDVDLDGKDGVQMSFSVKYLLEAIGTIDAPLTPIKIYDETSPCVIEPVGGPGAKGLVMPMKV